MGYLLKNLRATPARNLNRAPGGLRDYCIIPAVNYAFFVSQFVEKQGLELKSKYQLTNLAKLVRLRINWLP